MAIAEPDVASQDEYATKEDIIEALENLSRADFLRLQNKAGQYYFGKDLDAMDIFQESVKRVLNETRHWRISGPNAIPFLMFMSGVIKSVADYENKRGKKDGKHTIVPELYIDPENPDLKVIDKHPEYEDYDIEYELLAEEKAQQIEELFKDDDRASIIIMGWTDGYSASEIQDMFDMTKTQYDSAVKKINRRMTKLNCSE